MFLLYRLLSTAVLIGLIVLFGGEPIPVIIGFILYVIVMVNIGRSSREGEKKAAVDASKQMAEKVVAMDEERLRDLGGTRPMSSDDKSRMKKCPYCAEWIKEEAIVCRYCQRDLDETAPRKATLKKKPKHLLDPYGTPHAVFQSIAAKRLSSSMIKTICGNSVSYTEIDNDNPTCAECISKRKDVTSEMLKILGGDDK